jgi:O-antigen ligase
MHWLVTAFVALLAMGCAIGLLQIVGGGQSGFYLYRVTNPDSPVGFFANRNHQALLLAVGLPILIYWAVESSRSLRSSVRIPVAAAIGILMIVMLFVNGSRAGLGLGALGLILGLFIFRRSLFPGQGKGRWARPVAIVVLTLLPMVAVLASRDLALRRAAGTELSEELRLQVVPVVVRMMNDFMPIGSGFGSFDPVHRYYEPTALLRPTYLNHAHNDLLELLVTGGLPAALLLVAFTGWMVRRSITLFKANTAPARLGLSAMTGVLLILLGSLVDYPLRTPLMMASMALLCAWIEMSTVSGAWRRELGS